MKKNWEIYNVFYISLLEQNIIRKKQIDKNKTKLNIDNNRKKYKLIVYTKKLKLGYLLKFYNFVFQKRYLKKKNI